ncbi:MAG TPA: hypothetical protein VF092_19290 [Longimicrobium sp.]
MTYTVAGVVLAMLAAAPLKAQRAPATPEMGAVNTVIDFRLNWVSDSTKFDACSVYRSIGRPANFPSGLRDAFHVALNRTTDPCAAAASAVDRNREVRVLVDSVTVGDSAAMVYLTVRKDEETYREDYHLVNPSPGGNWGFDRVVVHGATRTYWVRPGMGPGRPRP